jgi:hypothetical protein
MRKNAQPVRFTRGPAGWRTELIGAVPASSSLA